MPQVRRKRTTLPATGRRLDRNLRELPAACASAGFLTNAIAEYNKQKDTPKPQTIGTIMSQLLARARFLLNHADSAMLASSLFEPAFSVLEKTVPSVSAEETLSNDVWEILLRWSVRSFVETDDPRPSTNSWCRFS